LPINSNNNVEDFRSICDKNKEQALVDTDVAETKTENKKLKKKYMKQGVAMASKYLQESLQLDVSVIDVELVIESKDIVGTDGCLAACLLDAGCAAIVMDGTDVEAMDAAKIPRERLVAHFSSEEAATPEAIAASLLLASTISVELLSQNSSLETVGRIVALVPEKKDKVSFQLAPGLLGEELHSLVSEISKKCKDGKGSIALVDPSATDLGLSFTACMRTDRTDGLYTTVVCTRSGEALGLVYSSKVGSFFRTYVDAVVWIFSGWCLTFCSLLSYVGICRSGIGMWPWSILLEIEKRLVEKGRHIWTLSDAPSLGRGL
jgi:hypothetical protein